MTSEFNPKDEKRVLEHIDANPGQRPSEVVEHLGPQVGKILLELLVNKKIKLSGQRELSLSDSGYESKSQHRLLNELEKAAQ